MRQMATIKTIDAVNPIPGADAIEVASIGGWKVVIRKDEYKVGDLAVYCELDSWMPTELAPFLSKGKEPREFEGIKGERLRTIKLRGQLSQGLLLNLDVALPFTHSFQVGNDVSEILNIMKWERPMPAQLAGMAKGNFPSSIPKTDQERAQNLKELLEIAVNNDVQFEVTEKLEGSSMTVYLIHGEFGVCSRNLDLKETEGNSFWSVARRDGIEEKMRNVDENWDYAIQGELIGPGVQGNIYKLSKLEFRVFDVYNIQAGAYMAPDARTALIERMGLLHAPVINKCMDIKQYGQDTIQQLLDLAEGTSELGDTEREGLVFKELTGGFSLKAVSNSYLMHHD